MSVEGVRVLGMYLSYRSVVQHQTQKCSEQIADL